MQPPPPQSAALAGARRRLEPAAAVADLGGLALFAFGVIATSSALHGVFGVYDEALIALNASLMNGGAAPYRDFYSNYPPGVFATVGLLFRVFGENVLVARWLGFAVHLAVALLAGRVAGQLRGRRFAWMPAGLLMLWLAQLELPPFAYLFGIGFALGAVALFQAARTTWTRGRWLACGACVGVGSFFRHDLFLYAAVVLCLFTAAWWALFHRKRLAASHARAAGWVGLAAAVTAALCWAPTFARAGFSQPLHDLFLDQVQHVMPGRVLPIPRLGELTVPQGPWSLARPIPAALHQQVEGALLLVFLGPLALLACLALAQRLKLDRPLLCVVGALGVAMIPQALGRTDVNHAIFAVGPPLILLWCYGEAVAARLTPVLLLVPLAVMALLVGYPVRGAVTLQARPDLPAQRMQNPRGKGAIGFEARDELVAEIEKRTAPGEPIYVGLTDHRRTFANELDLYFLSGRPGSTRYLQFDPNLANRPEVQAEMIRELEAKGTRLAVLSKKYTGMEEPNESRLYRSELLDRYLAEKFEVVARVNDDYFILMRRSPQR
jgi:hypothetical protein